MFVEGTFFPVMGSATSRKVCKCYGSFIDVFRSMLLESQGEYSCRWVEQDSRVYILRVASVFNSI